MRSFVLETFEDRFRYLVTVAGSVKAAAEVAGIHPNAMSRYKNSSKKIPVDVLVALADNAKVTVNWVYRGGRNMWIDGDDNPYGDELLFWEGNGPDSNVGMGRAVAEAMGTGGENVIMRVIQDAAMTPTVNIGDILFVDPNHTLNTGIYLIRANGRETVARITLTPNSYILSYDNDKYLPEPVEFEAVESLGIVGRVVSKLSPVNGI